MLPRLRRIETLEAIQEGIASAERGDLKAAAQVLDEIAGQIWLIGLDSLLPQRLRPAQHSNAFAQPLKCTQRNGSFVCLQRF